MLNKDLKQKVNHALFFYAIQRFSKLISRNNISTLKKIATKLTDNPLKALMAGAGSSALMQSNQAVSSIALMLVNTGIITSIQSLPIMLGTPLGTASTSFLISIKSENMEELLIIAGAILKFTKHKNIGHIVFYFGLLMFSLELMSKAFNTIQDVENFKKIFLFTNNSFILFLIGAVASFVTQGAFVIGILTILVGSNILPMYNANAMAIGVAMGSTLFIGIIVLSMNKEAKKAWAMHSVLVLICCLAMLPFVKVFTFIGDVFGGGDFGFAVSNLASRALVSFTGMYIYRYCLLENKLGKITKKMMHKIFKVKQN